MILKAILSKAGLPVLIGIASFIGGVLFQAKVLRPNIVVESKPVVNVPKCPDCNCPPTLGNDLDKIKNTRGTVNLHFHQNYTMAGDTVGLRSMIEESVNKVLEQHKIKRR